MKKRPLQIAITNHALLLLINIRAVQHNEKFRTRTPNQQLKFDCFIMFAIWISINQFADK